MTSPVPEPSSAQAHDDARFAAYLADLAAHVDDPKWGEQYRAILNDDPETQRADFRLAEAIAANPLQTPPVPLLYSAIVLLLTVILGAVAVLGLLP